MHYLIVIDNTLANFKSSDNSKNSFLNEKLVPTDKVEDEKPRGFCMTEGI